MKNLSDPKDSEEEKIKEEFINALHELYPNSYPANFSEWNDKLPMKKHVDNNDVQVMKKNTAIYKKELEKNKEEVQKFKEEWIETLSQLYPHLYSSNFEDWSPDSWGKKVINSNNIDAINIHLPKYKTELAEKKSKELFALEAEIDRSLGEVKPSPIYNPNNQPNKDENDFLQKVAKDNAAKIIQKYFRAKKDQILVKIANEEKLAKENFSEFLKQEEVSQEEERKEQEDLLKKSNYEDASYTISAILFEYNFPKVTPTSMPPVGIIGDNTELTQTSSSCFGKNNNCDIF